MANKDNNSRKFPVFLLILSVNDEFSLCPLNGKPCFAKNNAIYRGDLYATRWRTIFG